MHEFKVWAPLLHEVELQTGSQRFPMRSGAGGWWKAVVESANAGSDYGFILDGEGPFPDPRSAWQPDGVNGLSRLVPRNFEWSDAEWQAPPLGSAVIYELHVGTFTGAGTFEAAIERLPHLVELGITHVELMPVVEFAGRRGWGYDGVDLFAANHLYGGPSGLKCLVNACHAQGLAVIIDVVYNHLGPLGNHLAKFGPYFIKRVLTPWGAAVNFDGPHSDEVRRFFCDNALMWLRDYHADGLRLDAVHAYFDTSATPFLEQLAREVAELGAQLGRHLVLIAESDLNDPRLLWPVERGGFGLDAQWSDDFHHALHTLLTGERDGYYSDFGSAGQLCKALREAYIHDGSFSNFRHRTHGRPVENLSGRRFLAYLQNHDQIGNRAQGERSSRLMSVGRLKIGAALVFTSPFVPMIFQGEEWGASTPFLFFTDYDDRKLAEGVRKGRSEEFAAFGWKPEELPDPQSGETYERSKLDWSECTRSPHVELLDWHRRLISLRREEASLRDGRRNQVETRFNEEERWLVVERGAISVACNWSDTARRIGLRTGRHRVLLASEKIAGQAADEVNLPADSVAILKSEEH
jgi:maltooligosyltrehalose trehalohydrolase